VSSIVAAHVLIYYRTMPYISADYAVAGFPSVRLSHAAIASIRYTAKHVINKDIHGYTGGGLS